MEDPKRFSGVDTKLPPGRWGEAVMRGVAESTPVHVFIKFFNTWNIAIVGVEDGNIVVKVVPTEDFYDKDSYYDPLVRMFRGVLNTGTIIGVGKEGTYFDYEVRFGVVSESGMIWLKDGEESDVIDVLTELVESSMPVSEEDEMQDSRQGSNSNMYIPKPKRDIAVGWTHQLAALMLRIPEGMKVAIVRGMDSDGKPFYFYTVPMFDEFVYRNSGYMEGMNTQDDTQMNNGEGKNIIYALDSDVVGFIRFPADIVSSLPERRLAAENFGRVVDTLVPEIINNPEKWITDI